MNNWKEYQGFCRIAKKLGGPNKVILLVFLLGLGLGAIGTEIENNMLDR